MDNAYEPLVDRPIDDSDKIKPDFYIDRPVIYLFLLFSIFFLLSQHQNINQSRKELMFLPN